MSFSLLDYNCDINVDYKEIEDKDVGEIYYRRDLIDVFKMNVNDLTNSNFFNILEQKVAIIFNNLPKDNKKLNHLLEIISNKFLGNKDYSYGFLFLFGYDYFQEVHKIISYYIKYNEINNELINNLINIL